MNTSSILVHYYREDPTFYDVQQRRGIECCSAFFAVCTDEDLQFVFTHIDEHDLELEFVFTLRLGVEGVYTGEAHVLGLFFFFHERVQEDFVIICYMPVDLVLSSPSFIVLLLLSMVI